MAKKKIPDPHILKIPTKENATFAAARLFRTGWAMWRNSKMDLEVSEMGFETLWAMAERCMIIDRKTNKPYKDRDDMREKFQKWIKKHEN